jgi:hypothetical protein
MDPTRFDTLTRSLAAPRTRRGLVGAVAALAIGVRAASAQAACPPGQTANRKGDCSCPPGTDACPDGCYDQKRDLYNCGRCGRTCIGGECRKGECRCPAGSVLCAGVCRSLASFGDDPENCGGCGISCDDGDACTTDTCSGGTCVHTPLSCDDGNACTTDTCDPRIGCVHTPNLDTCTAENGAPGKCWASDCYKVPKEEVNGITFNVCTGGIGSPLSSICLNAYCGCEHGVIGAEDNLCASQVSPYTSCTSHDDCPEGTVCSGLEVFRCTKPCS